METAKPPFVALVAALSVGVFAEPTLTGETSDARSLFVFGSDARMTLEAKGLKPGEKRPLSIVLKDAYNKTVGEIANDGIVADKDGAWKGEFPLRTDFLGFRRVCVSSGDLTLPKLGSRPKGCLTYAVFTDWTKRPKLAEEDYFFGLQGGNFTKWVGAHFLYARSNPLPDLEKSKAYQRELLEGEFPVYGTISAEYRFIKSFMTKEAAAYFSAREKDAPRMPFSVPAGDVVGERLFKETMKTFAAAARAARPGRRVYEYGLECDINSPDHETVVRSMKAAYEAIHEADPEGMLFAAGISNVLGSKLDYMRRLFDLGIAAYMDGFNIHPYTPYPPERHSFIENIRAFVRLVRDRKGPDTPMISTEQGFAAPCDKEVMQMEGNVRVALILLGEGFCMHCAFWGYDFGNDHYNWFDGDYGYNYNLDLQDRNRRWSGRTSPRPSLPALSAACLFFDGKRPVTPIEGLGSSAIGYAYADSGENCALALWDHGGVPNEVAIDVGRDEIEVADIMGNVRRVKTRDGLLSLTLTGSPCYVLDPDPGLWGHKGTMKAKIAEEIEQRRRREEAARQAEICSVLPMFAGGSPGVKVEVSNRTSFDRVYSVGSRIRGVPGARRSAKIRLAAHEKGWVEIPFSAGTSFDPSEIRDVEVTVSFGDEYRSSRSARLNFLEADRQPDEVGVGGDFSAWKGPDRLLWPVEKGGPQVRMALGWNKAYLLVDMVVADDVFTNRWTGFDTWRGDSVQLGIARRHLQTPTGNFQTDVQEEAKSEITLAMTKNGPSAYRTATFDPDRFPCDLKGGGEIPASLMPLEIKIATNGCELVTRYRAAVPWAFLNVRDPDVGMVVRLAAFSNDNDGMPGMPRYTHWFDLKGAAPRNFAYVTLGGAGRREGRPGDGAAAVREIGQSQRPGTPPVEWTACDWCVADRDHNVYLPGGWRIPRNSGEAAKCVDEVGGHMFSDGCGGIWSWNERTGDVTEVLVDSEGLKRGRKVFTTKSWENYMFFAAPPGLRAGYAQRAKFGVLRRYLGVIRGYDADGNDIGVLFDCRSAGMSNAVCAAFHPATGELLVGNEWPDRHVHCIDAEGRDRQTGVWPYPRHTLAINSVDGGDVFFSGVSSERLGNTLATSKRLIFGQFAAETHALADGGDCWWLATTQGAQRYLKRDPSFCAGRIGGIARADRIAVKDGKVLVADGKRMYMFWIDGEPDEIMCSTERLRVNENTMPADMAREDGGWCAEYDSVRKAIRVFPR